MVGGGGAQDQALHSKILNDATSPTKSEGRRSEKREEASLEKSKATTEGNDRWGTMQNWEKQMESPKITNNYVFFWD